MNKYEKYKSHKSQTEILRQEIISDITINLHKDEKQFYRYIIMVEGLEAYERYYRHDADRIFEELVRKYKTRHKFINPDANVDGIERFTKLSDNLAMMIEKTKSSYVLSIICRKTDIKFSLNSTKSIDGDFIHSTFDSIEAHVNTYDHPFRICYNLLAEGVRPSLVTSIAKELHDGVIPPIRQIRAGVSTNKEFNTWAKRCGLRFPIEQKVLQPKPKHHNSSFNFVSSTKVDKIIMMVYEKDGRHELHWKMVGVYGLHKVLVKDTEEEIIDIIERCRNEIHYINVRHGGKRQPLSSREKDFIFYLIENGATLLPLSRLISSMTNFQYAPTYIYSKLKDDARRHTNEK